jgi:UDP-N-acetylmuramoylalanine--D-glutamate ligase
MSVLVLGAGTSGSSAGRLARSDGHDVAYFDDDPNAADKLAGAAEQLVGSPWNAGFLDGVELVIASPGFSPTATPMLDAVSASVPVMSEAAFGLSHTETPYVAITGTNGKTTVTDAVASMLVASGVDAIAAGNIGLPVSDIVSKDHDVIVLELSSFQLYLSAVHPFAAGLVNIATDHLDWHGSVEAYVAAKARIFESMTGDDVLAYNADDSTVVDVVAGARCVTVPCSGRTVPADGNGVDGNDLMIDGVRVETSATAESFRLDLVIAATVALAAGATIDGIRTVAGNFSPGQHRRHEVGIVNGVAWINDSKATNPHAAVAASHEYDSVRLLAGGRNKDLDLTPMGQISSIRFLYAFGESAQDIAAIASVPNAVFPTMRSAMEAAHSDAVAGDTVLLSPGCASFDEFTSYAERGEAFEQFVREIQEDKR